MALVSAPAGYGKTTLVSEWVHELCRESDENDKSATGIAWLSLDDGDNDPQRFLAHCIAALSGVDGTIGRDALGMLQTPKAKPSEIILTSLINDVAAVASRMMLVLDDYHLIESTEIDDIVSFLLEHLPEALYVVIATRADPNLRLARLRAGDELTEIRARDLRFSLSEITDFLNHMMGLNLSAEDIGVLEARTEGWIAGLHLAALSLRGREAAVGSIESFTGSQRHVMDYLFEEVLSRQTERIQEFLMSTAVLTRLSPSLCCAVSGAEDSEEIIEAIDRANLFLIPLDGKRYWYRYHHLFAELLLQRLDRTHPKLRLELHRRAATWWNDNGFIDQAIEHALICGDPGWAASMLEARVEELWHRGEGMTIWSWMKRLPTEAVNAKPMLCIMGGYFLHGAGEKEEAEQFFDLAEKLIAAGNREIGNNAMQSDKESSIHPPALAGKLAAVRALMHSFWGDVQETMRYADQAADILPKGELIWHNYVAIAIAEIGSFLCDTAAAEKASKNAIEASKSAGNDYSALIAYHKLVVTLLEQGRLIEALEICQEQLRTTEERGLSMVPIAGSWFLSLGEILNQTDNGEDALANATKGMTLDQRSNYLPVRRCWSYFAFMRVLLSQSNFAEIEEKIQKMRALAAESSAPDWVASQAEMWQARVWLERDRLDLAVQWMERSNLQITGMPDELDLFHFQEYVVAARVLIGDGRLEDAREMLARLHELAQTNGLVARNIEVLSLSALALQEEGDMEQAIDTIGRALSPGEQGGFVRIFVDEGPRMARLLYEAAARGVSPSYVRKLLTAFPPQESEEAERPHIVAANDKLFEAFTDRELDVLRLISEGLTNKEIGSKLFISEHTVKTHARNIYAKLETHTRTQAVSKARGLGLLPPV